MMQAAGNMANADINAETVGANLVVSEAKLLEAYYNTANEDQKNIIQGVGQFYWMGTYFTDYGVPPLDSHGAYKSTEAAEINSTEILANMVNQAYSGSEQMLQSTVQSGQTTLQQISHVAQSGVQFEGQAIQVLQAVAQMLMQEL